MTIDPQLEEAYIGMLDEIYEEVDVGLTFNPSRVLKACDPVAYYQGYLDYVANFHEGTP